MRYSGVVALAFLVAAAAQARADTIALSFTGGSSFTPDGASVGWAFTTSSDITVTQLGVWDRNADGLGEAHEVAIFTSGGVALMTATVASGSTDPISSGFRYNSTISGTTSLSAGTYIIAAYYAATVDGVTQLADTVSTASGILYAGSRIAFTAGLSAPLTAGAANSYFGPNFQFNAAVATPEPRTFALFGLGGLALTGVVVRRRRVAKRPA